MLTDKQAWLANEARIWRFDQSRGLLLAWNGGQGIHVYNGEGHEVDYFQLGGHELNATPRQVRAGMRTWIEAEGILGNGDDNGY